MKLIACLLTCAFIITSPLMAGSVKEIYTSVNEEIELYYQATGDWSLLKVSEMRFVPSESQDFIIISAEATIRNIHNGRGITEICLVTYKVEDLEFQTINCF